MVFNSATHDAYINDTLLCLSRAAVLPDPPLPPLFCKSSCRPTSPPQAPPPRYGKTYPPFEHRQQLSLPPYVLPPPPEGCSVLASPSAGPGTLISNRRAV
jgi:hypothetical protein